MTLPCGTATATGSWDSSQRGARRCYSASWPGPGSEGGYTSEGLITRLCPCKHLYRAARTLSFYAYELNPTLFGWFNDYMKRHPIPKVKKCGWNEVSESGTCHVAPPGCCIERSPVRCPDT